MSQRLIDAGHAVSVFDANAEATAALKKAGATVASSPDDIGNSADIDFVSLPTPAIVQSVVLDGIGRGSRAKIIVDLSTSGPGMAGRVSTALKERGIAWIDAPVSGGIAGAKGGTLAVMASGPRATFDVVEPLLKNFGKVFYVGEKAGLAFQIVDDILDVEGDSRALGKTVGKDAADDKPTYPSLFGLDRARTMAAECTDHARAILAEARLDQSSLPALAEWVLTRKN